MDLQKKRTGGNKLAEYIKRAYERILNYVDPAEKNSNMLKDS